MELVRFDPEDPSIAYACDLGARFYRSTDGGESWSQPVSTGGGPYCYDIVRVNDQLFAPTVGGLFVSPDNGSSWSATSLTVGSRSVA